MNVIVTGANRGIGEQIMISLAASGNNIWACTREITKEWENMVSSLCLKYDIWIKPIRWDGLEHPDSIKNAAKTIGEDAEKIDVLINNAGSSYTNTFLMTPMKEIRNMFEVNFFGPVFFTQMIVKKMIRQKSGKIINITSVRGIKAEAGNISYGVAKSALAYATQIMAEELWPYGISVFGVAPGMIPTDINKYKTKEQVEKICENTALGHLGDTKDIVNAIRFLIEGETTLMNGQILVVDGGYV